MYFMDKREIPKPKFNWDLSGTDNNGFRHRYSLLKDESFKNNFLNFMAGLEFNWESIENKFYYEDESGQFRENKVIDFLDVCWHFENKNFEVDVFFGSSKIIMVIRTRNRRKLIDTLVNFTEFVKPLTYEDIESLETEKISVKAINL